MGGKRYISGWLLGSLLFIACQTENTWETWVEKNIRPLSPPETTANNDLYFLDTLLADKPLVILGEETHGEGSTTEYKLRLIRYLNQKLGYNVLLMEGLNFYAGSIENKDLSAAETATRNSSLSVLRSEKFSPVYTWVADSVLQLKGIDTNQTPITPLFIDSLQDYISHTTRDNFSMDWDNMSALNHYLYNRRNAVPASETELKNLFLKTDSLIQDLQIAERYLSGTGDNTLRSNKNSYNTLRRWLQNIENRICELQDFRLTAESLYLNKQFVLDSLTRTSIAKRDRQMAENIRWMKTMYPDEKFIIWTATVHGLKSYDTFSDEHRSRFNYRKPLRGYLDEWFPGQTYTIAFNDYEGSVNDGKRLKGTLPVPSPGSLEAVMNRYYPYSFIDFSACRDSSLIDNKFKANLVGGEKEGSWMQAVDGVLFIRQQTPLY